MHRVVITGYGCISALGHRDLARAAIPFLVLFPGAVWVGVSADGLFTGVTATGVALLALGATGRPGHSPEASYSGSGSSCPTGWS